MEVNNPSAIASENIKALIPLTNPFKMFPSIKSVKQLMSGTPGMRNKTEVAKACSMFKPNV